MAEAVARPAYGRRLWMDSSGDSPDKTDGSGLEEYAHGLETRLAMKSALLDQAIRMHESLEARYSHVAIYLLLVM